MSKSLPRRFVILRHDVPDDAVARLAAGRGAGRARGSGTARDSGTGRDSGPSRDGGVKSSVGPGSFLSTSHWDWMFEPWGSAAWDAKMLWTWATPILFPHATDVRDATDVDAVSTAGDLPSGRLGLPFERTFESDAVRLADHRPDYLNHEGPVSGGRGDVTRLLSGTYEMTGPEAEGPDPQRESTEAGEHEASPRPTTTMRLAWYDPESGQERFGRLVLQRRWDDLSDDDPARAVWRLRFSPIW